MMAKMPPTQSESATTCTTREPIANWCEPLEALWLWNTGIVRVISEKSKRIVAARTVRTKRIARAITAIMAV